MNYFDKNIIKELYPGAEDLMFPPMLIHSSTDMQLKQACESGEYFGQIKKDGALYQYVKSLDGKSYLFGRTISKKTGVLTEKGANVPHIMSALDSLPNGTVIIGEIYYPKGTSKDVTPIMGCLPEKAIERQNDGYGKIHYYIHDIIICAGVNLISAQIENELRYNILKKIYEKYELNKFDFLELAEVWYDNLYQRIGDTLSAGEEGMVIKKKSGVYEPGKRPLSNLKAKKVDFADVVIIGFEEPTQEYYGKELDSWEFNTTEDGRRLKGRYIDLTREGKDVVPVTKPWYYEWYNARIKIGAYDKEGNIINIGTIHSGISDEMKKDMTENPKKYLGKVCAIQVMEKDSHAKTFRHGFFRALRNDKNPKECLIEEVF